MVGLVKSRRHSIGLFQRGGGRRSERAREGADQDIQCRAHGECWGDVGHCDIPEPVSAFDQRPPHPLLPFDATLEITEALSALPDDTGEFTVTVLAFNKNADTDGVLRFKELTLLTYA